MNDCLFCSIVSGEDRRASIVYQDDLVLAMIAQGAANPGHVLILPREHIERLAALGEETGMQMFRIAMRLQRAIEKAGAGCEGTYIDLAEGVGTFQMMPHIYMNLVPRFEWDRYYALAVIDSPYDDPAALFRKLAEDRARRWRGETPTASFNDSSESADEWAARIRDSYAAIWGSST